MTIDEAIKILTAWKETGEDMDTERLNQAEELGIEALKRVKWHKEQHQPGYYELLPGETNEKVKRR